MDTNAYDDSQDIYDSQSPSSLRSSNSFSQDQNSLSQQQCGDRLTSVSNDKKEKFVNESSQIPSLDGENESDQIQSAQNQNDLNQTQIIENLPKEMEHLVEGEVKNGVIEDIDDENMEMVQKQSLQSNMEQEQPNNEIDKQNGITEESDLNQQLEQQDQEILLEEEDQQYACSIDSQIENQKHETFMQKKLREYKEELYKEFGTSSLNWKPKLSKLEQAKVSALSNRQETQNSKAKDKERQHYEAWGLSTSEVPSLSSLMSASKVKMSKLEQEKEDHKKQKEQEQSQGLNDVKKFANRLSNASQQSNCGGGFMADIVKKHSKLEMEKENTKKRQYSEITQGNDPNPFDQEQEAQAKRQKLNHQQSSLSSTGGGFLSDVVIRKSRIELEKEAALKAQMEEKENILRNINQKGLVMKFDTIEKPIQRNSKSPSQSNNFGINRAAQSQQRNQSANRFSKQQQSNESKMKVTELSKKEVNEFQNSVVHEVDPNLEQTMIKDQFHQRLNSYQKHRIPSFDFLLSIIKQVTIFFTNISFKSNSNEKDPYGMSLGHRKGSQQTNTSRQNRFNNKEEKNKEVNDFWNGKERFLNNQMNEWHLMDYYQQQLCFNNNEKDLNSTSKVQQYKQQEENTSMCYSVIDNESNLRNLSLDKFDKKQKLNQLYFNSQIKSMILQSPEASAARESIFAEQDQQSRKKTSHELKMNRIMFQSVSMNKLLNGNETLRKKQQDYSSIKNPQSKLNSYNNVGKETETQSRRSNSRHVERKIREMQGSFTFN